MKIALLAAAIAALSSPVLAQEWQLVGVGNGMMAMRTDNIERTEHRAFANVLLVWDFPGEDGTEYTVSYVEFDCWERDRFRMATTTAFRVRGVVNSPPFDGGEWEEVRAGSLAETGFKIACRQQRADRSRNFRDRDPHDIAADYLRGR